MRIPSLPAVVVPLAAVLLSACSSAPAPSPMGSSHAALGAGPTAAVAPEREDRVPLAAVDEGAIVEGVESRDPFRAYAADVTPPPEDVRPRKSRRFAVDQLKLIGLVTRTASPRAMLVDPRGKGWIVSQGDLVGRAETIRAGAAERAVSWRVDRIRENELVLVRDDASALGAPATTRVLALQQEPLLQQDD